MVGGSIYYYNFNVPVVSFGGGCLLDVGNLFRNTLTTIFLLLRVRGCDFCRCGFEATRRRDTPLLWSGPDQLVQGGGFARHD